MKTMLPSALFVGFLGIFILYWHHSAGLLDSRKKLLAALETRLEQMRTEERGLLERTSQTRMAIERNQEAIAQKAQIPAEPSAPEDPFLVKIRELANNAAGLYGIFEQTPGAAIPELTLLSTNDWLKLGTKDLGTPEAMQEKLSEVRSAAKSKLVRQLGEALKKWKTANPSVRLGHVNQLRPFLGSSITGQMLERYEIAPSDQWQNILAKSGINRAATDPNSLLIVEKTTVPGAREGAAFCMLTDNLMTCAGGNR